MDYQLDPLTPLERAILEQIAFLEGYLAQLRIDRERTTDTAGDPFKAAYRDPGFQRWQLQKRLERPL